MPPIPVESPFFSFTMLSTEIQLPLPHEQLQHCLEPGCFDGSSIQQYEYQCQPYKNYQLQYQYQYPVCPAEYSSPSPGPSLLSPVSPPFPYGIMSVDHNISPISGVSSSPSPSDTNNTHPQQRYQPRPHPQQQQQIGGQHHQLQPKSQQERYHQHPNPPLEKGVLEALEIARDTEEGMNNETVRGLLERAITTIWGKVLEQPDTYILGKDEFSVFNFFQHRFEGNQIAIAARKRFWESYRG